MPSVDRMRNHYDEFTAFLASKKDVLSSSFISECLTRLLRAQEDAFNRGAEHANRKTS